MNATQIPAHVPSELVVDFDYFAPEGSDRDPFLALAPLHEKPAFFWTPRNGGHWVATRGPDIKEILGDYQTFSSSAVFIPKINRPRLVPVEQDPPEHTEYRRLMMPAFTPDSVEKFTAPARMMAAEIIDEFYADGECEFIMAFGVKLPMLIFLNMSDLPLADFNRLLQNANDNSRGDAATRERAWNEISAYVSKLIKERRAHPGEDVISNAINGQVFGRAVNDSEAFGIVNAFLGGGFDTVQATMGWIAKFLAESPEHRRQLVAEPSLIPRAIDEMLRRFSISNIARVVRNDMSFKGVDMKSGEQILLPAILYSFDETIFKDPFKVDFKRPDARMHMTFSNGVHKCPGQNLGIAQLRIFLEEWLKRIPDFRIKPGTVPKTATGIVHGVTEMWLEWDVK
ncbi:MAG: cytochrome P450 [Alphaproteobacteria bacterium]